MTDENEIINEIKDNIDGYDKEQIDALIDKLSSGETITQDDIYKPEEIIIEKDDIKIEQLNDKIEDIKEGLKEYIAGEKSIIDSDKYSDTEKEEAGDIADFLELTLNSVESIEFKDITDEKISEINNQLDNIERSIEERDDAEYIVGAINDMMGEDYTSIFSDKEEEETETPSSNLFVTLKEEGYDVVGYSENAIVRTEDDKEIMITKTEDGFEVALIDVDGEPIVNDEREEMSAKVENLDDAIEKIEEFSTNNDENNPPCE